MTLLRATAFNLFFFIVTPLIAACVLLMRALGWDYTMQVGRFWSRLMLAALRHLCGIHVVITGTEHLPPGGPALLACQHQSAFDTVVWFGLLPKPSYVVKQELTRIPLYGALMRPAGMIPVDRTAGAAALRGLVHDTVAAKAAGRQIVIFPEGTRVAPGHRVALQPGIAAIATRLGLPVIPVATDSGLRWGRRAYRKNPGPIHIAVGRPIPPGTRRTELLAAIETFWRQQEAAGFRPVDNSVEDCAVLLPESLNGAPQPT